MGSSYHVGKVLSIGNNNNNNTGRPSLVRQSVIRNNQLFGIIFSTGR